MYTYPATRLRTTQPSILPSLVPQVTIRSQPRQKSGSLVSAHVGSKALQKDDSMDVDEPDTPQTLGPRDQLAAREEHAPTPL